MTSKIQQLRELANQRRSTSAGTKSEGYSKDYCKLGEFCDGVFDKDWHVSPLSFTAQNTDTKLMLVLQDWASADFLNKEDAASCVGKGYDESLRTNQNLFELIHDYFGVEFSEIYATNCFVFVKNGGMQAPIPQRDLVLSAREFALEEIKIIQPKLVICIGKGTYDALAKANGLNPKSMDSEHGFIIGNTKVVGVYHTGQRGVVAAGGYPEMRKQWQKLAETFRKLL